MRSRWPLSDDKSQKRVRGVASRTLTTAQSVALAASRRCRACAVVARCTSDGQRSIDVLRSGPRGAQPWPPLDDVAVDTFVAR